MKPCLFKERFKYEPCRSCDGLDRNCKNYLSQPVRRRLHSRGENYANHNTTSPHDTNVKVIDYGLIRLFNDGGVI